MKVKIYPGKKNSCEVRYKVAGDWVRETVPEEAAEARKAEVEQYLEQMTIPLSHDEAQEYRVAKHRLNGGDLINAVDNYISRQPSAVLLRSAIDCYLEWSLAQGHAKSTLRTKQTHLMQFAKETWEDTTLAEANSQWVADYLVTIQNSKTHNNIRITLMGFFNWAQKKELLPFDIPHALHNTYPKVIIGKDPISFTPDEYRKLLRQATKDGCSDVTTILVFGGMAGIRMAEISRMRWGDVWKNNFFHITLGAGITKTHRRRMIEVTDQLRNIIEWMFRRYGTPLEPDITSLIYLKNKNRALKHLASRAGVEWKKNGLRKGFVSYSCALRPVDDVAKDAGHSVETLETTYKGLVTKEDAEAWFNTFPACTPEISGV